MNVKTALTGVVAFSALTQSDAFAVPAATRRYSNVEAANMRSSTGYFQPQEFGGYEEPLTDGGSNSTSSGMSVEGQVSTVAGVLLFASCVGAVCKAWGCCESHAPRTRPPVDAAPQVPMAPVTTTTQTEAETA